jgi:hypothetical protein
MARTSLDLIDLCARFLRCVLLAAHLESCCAAVTFDNIEADSLCLLGISAKRRSPLSVKATTDGVVRAPRP